MTLISIWIPILITIIGVIYLFTIDRLTDLIPGLGLLDTPIVLLIIAGAWLIYIIDVNVSRIIQSALGGDATTIITIMAVLLGIGLFLRYKR